MGRRRHMRSLPHQMFLGRLARGACGWAPPPVPSPARRAVHAVCVAFPVLCPRARRSETSKQSLRPLTVKQLADANAASGGAELLLDGEPVENFTLVGKIRRGQAWLPRHASASLLSCAVLSFVAELGRASRRSTHPLPTYLEVKLDDGTGVADVRLWLDEDATASAAQVAELQPGRYVRVYGAFRSVADTPSIQVRASACRVAVCARDACLRDTPHLR